MNILNKIKLLLDLSIKAKELEIEAINDQKTLNIIAQRSHGIAYKAGLNKIMIDNAAFNQRLRFLESKQVRDEEEEQQYLWMKDVKLHQS